MRLTGGDKTDIIIVVMISITVSFVCWLLAK